MTAGWRKGHPVHPRIRSCLAQSGLERTWSSVLLGAHTGLVEALREPVAASALSAAPSAVGRSGVLGAVPPRIEASLRTRQQRELNQARLAPTPLNMCTRQWHAGGALTAA